MIEEIEQMQNFLEIECSENPQEIIERGHTLSVYMARTGVLLAQAKKTLNEKKAMLYESLKTNLPASAINEFVKSKLNNEAFIVDWLDRINRTCVHQQEWCRSVLSYEREQLKNLK